MKRRRRLVPFLTNPFSVFTGLLVNIVLLTVAFQTPSFSGDRLLFSCTSDKYTHGKEPCVIVVGKIIVDEYGSPDTFTERKVTVGGGGPQAAMGAALALAAVKYQNNDEGLVAHHTPPPQPVVLMGAVGDLDFGENEEKELQDTLNDALLKPVVLLRGNGCVTPRIRLWHEGDDQLLKWYAVDDSFGNERGAGKLWANLPSISDYQRIINQCTTLTNGKPILHVICEGGTKAPGANGDSDPLVHPSIQRSISCLGVEPILFPNDDSLVSVKEAIHCSGLLQNVLDSSRLKNDNNKLAVSVPFIISPDNASFQAMNAQALPCVSPGTSLFYLDSWAVRNGPNGSYIVSSTETVETNYLSFPAATLDQLVNPTGAGNAYAAAYTTLRGYGYNINTSASIANGVGAVFCEYEHCPPYSYKVLNRILGAHSEVQEKLYNNI